MSVFIPSTGIDNVRALATSALPDAPVEPDDTRSGNLAASLRRLVMRLRRTSTPAPAQPRPGMGRPVTSSAG